MATMPRLIVFDVNETLSDTAPLGPAFETEGLPALAARTWFAALLRDGFAAAAAGDNVPFAAIAEGGLERLLAEHGAPDPRGATRRIMRAMQGLDARPDVVPGIRALCELTALATLSNGAASIAEGLLDRAGISDRFEALLSVADAPAWKPARSAYAYAAEVSGLSPGELLLVAVHPWDIHGASRAGLRTAWINRDGSAYPAYFARAELEARDLSALAAQLAAGA